MPEPAVALSAGGSSFGTSVNSSRQRLAGFGTPEPAKSSSGLSICGSEASAFAAFSASANGSPCRTERLSIDATTRRRSAMSSAGWLAACALRSLSARTARSTSERRPSIAVRSGDTGEATDAAGADLIASMSVASFPDWARAPAMSVRKPASDFSSASSREASAGSGAAGFDARPSSSARRDESASMAPALISATGCAVSAGRPTAQATAITSAAVTAPVMAATRNG